MISRVESFTKALYVIDSCVSRQQLQSAERYVELFENMFTGGRKEQQMSGLVASEGRARETGYEQWLSR